MNIVHFGTYDQIGGAARAMSRLHQALQHEGHRSTLAVRHASNPGPHVVTPPIHVGLPARLHRRLRRWRYDRQVAAINRIRPRDSDGFDGDRAPYGADLASQATGADVIHLHWTSHFLELAEFLPVAARIAPVVWTHHDLNGLTGGCHYPRGCEGWRTGCSRCPQLTGDPASSLAQTTWNRVHAGIRSIPAGRLHLVAASSWVESMLAASPHFSGHGVSRLALGLDTSAYAPRNRRFARDLLGLPLEAEILLFVSDTTNNPRKGLDVLGRAVARLRDRKNLLLVSVGQGGAPLVSGVNQRHLGASADDRWLSLAYSAADVFVIPSREEAFGQTLLEAMACGVASAGSHTGGIPDLIRQGETGMLFPPGDDAALATIVRQLLDQPELRETLGHAARHQVERNHSLNVYATRHTELYSRLIS